MQNSCQYRLCALMLAFLLLCSSCAATNGKEEGSPVLSDGSEPPSALSAGFCPSTGKVTLPVIPIGFSDQPFTDEMLVSLKVALNSQAPGAKTSGGSAGSVSSFYTASSYGALNLTFDVLSPVTLTLPSWFHQYIYARGDNTRTDAILHRAMSKLDDTVDFSLYDADQDGNLDGVLLIYAVPENSEAERTLWWSWFDYTWRDDCFDGVKPLGYVWSSYSCLLSTSEFTMTEEIDPYVLIHETGHLLGLEDYYDTDLSVGVAGGLGFFDIMDADFGDHAPFSKYQLGWIEPTVVMTEGIYEIRDFSTSGDVLLLPFGNFEGFGSEYIMIDLFSPSGLGVLAPYWFGIETPVVRAWHVDARVKPDLRLDQYENLDGFYLSDNATSPHKLLSYIEADGDASMEKDDAYACDSDFYGIDDTISGVTSYTGTPLPFSIRVLSIKNGVARLEVTHSAG